MNLPEGYLIILLLINTFVTIFTIIFLYMNHNRRYNDQVRWPQEVKVSNQQCFVLGDKLQPDRDVKETDPFSVSKEDATIGKLPVPIKETMASFVGKENPSILKNKANCLKNMTENLSSEQELPCVLSQKCEKTNWEKVLADHNIEPGDDEETSSIAQENSEESIEEECGNLRVNLKVEEKHDEFCQDLSSLGLLNLLNSTLEKGKESESENGMDTIQQLCEIHKMSEVADETHLEEVLPNLENYNIKLRDDEEASSLGQENSEPDGECKQKSKERTEEENATSRAEEEYDEASSMNGISKELQFNNGKCLKDEEQLFGGEKQKMKKKYPPIVGSDIVRREDRTKSRQDEAGVLEQLAEEREKRKRAEEKIVKLTEENYKLKQVIQGKDERLKRYEATTKENHDESNKKILSCVAKGKSELKISLLNVFCQASCTLQSFFFACSLRNGDLCSVKFVKKIQEKLQNTAITEDPSFPNCSFYLISLLKLGLLESSPVEEITSGRENLNEALKQQMSKLRGEGEFIALLRVGFKGSDMGHCLVIIYNNEESDPSVMMLIYDAQIRDWWPKSEDDINNIDKIQVFKIKKQEVKEFLRSCGKESCLRDSSVHSTKGSWCRYPEPHRL